MMNWVSINLKNTSFRVKIIIIIFVAILVPTVTVSAIMYKKSENAITGQASRIVTNSMDFVISNIDSSLKAINEMSNTILTDNRLTSIIDLEGSFIHGDREQKYSELRDLLSSFSNRIKSTYMLDGIDSYYLYIADQRTIIDSKTTYFENVKEDNIDFLRGLKDNRNIDTWFVSSPFEENILGFSQSRLVGDKLITYDKVLKDDEGKTKAVLAINVDSNFISDKFNQIQTGTSGDIIAMDKDGNLVSYSDKNMIGLKTDEYKAINTKITGLGKNSGSFFYKTANTNDFIIYSISEYTGWRYTVIIPASQVLGQILEMQNFLVIMISVTILFVFGITYLLSLIFYKPLEKIVSAMQKIENRNLDVRIDDNRGDEYHKVYKGFNDMVTELKRLINDLVNEKLLKKEADIKLLQAQINPHFLYNTLESIHSIAKIKKVDEIARMVSALSKFFRISLSGGKDLVTLKDAIDLALNYLTIQNIRFNGKISYNINVPDELTGCIVPKLILQPVVENSIYHGIEKRKGDGLLTISAQTRNNELQLVVEDNGVGIPEKELFDLRKSIEIDNFEDSKNFALKNLNRQIKLKYGSDYGVNIDSIEGTGTVVSIRLPIIQDRGIS